MSYGSKMRRRIKRSLLREYKLAILPDIKGITLSVQELEAELEEGRKRKVSTKEVRGKIAASKYADALGAIARDIDAHEAEARNRRFFAIHR